MTKNFTISLIALLCSISLQAQKKQNVIFIAVDDLSIAFDTYGNMEVPAPNISRLAQHGVLFMQAYCQYTLCSPSRTSALSGRRPDATNVFDNIVDIRNGMGADFKFLPEYLDQLGYRTENYGKIGPCNHERDISWDYYFDNDGFAYTSPSGEPYWCIDTVHANETETRPGLNTTAFTDRLKEGVQEPYFMALGLSTHAPFTPTLDAWNILGDETFSVPLPVNIYGGLDNVFGNSSSNISLPLNLSGDTLDIPEPALTTPKVYPDGETRQIRHAFYAEIIQMDQQIGRLLDVMDSLHTWDSSVVVFWSDHGLSMGEHQGQWLKHNLFEESLHVPFIICAPGYKPGVCNRLVENVDLYPTLTELCNIPTPDSLEGSSLVPLLEKPDAFWKKAVFSQVKRKKNFDLMGRTVRNERFHYNNWPGYGEELYDIINDPFEITNLATDPAWEDSLNAMRNISLGGWQNAKPPTYQKSGWFKDMDGDGFGNNTDSVLAYFMPEGYAPVNGDCDDTRMLYADGDGDTYGAGSPVACGVTNYTDCNDNNAAINPEASEVCNGIDDDCDGSTDEGATTTFYADADADGFGDAAVTTEACIAPSGYVINSSDCNDQNNRINPNATEKKCNGIDDNCNSAIDENKRVPIISKRGNLDICTTDSVFIFTSQSALLSYQWKKDGVAVPGATSFGYMVKEPGSYTVEVTVSGCSSISLPATVFNSCGRFITFFNRKPDKQNTYLDSGK